MGRRATRASSESCDGTSKELAQNGARREAVPEWAGRDAPFALLDLANLSKLVMSKLVIDTPLWQ
jgi:hypothetical protein